MIVKQPDEKFPTAPEGTFPAVCVDEIDLGKMNSVWNGEERERHMVRIVWQIEEEDADGKPFLVRQDYTASLDEKAKLRKVLQSWRGRAFTQAELMGFDMENVVGVGCMVNIVHAKGSRGGTFANVEAVMKLPKSMEAPRPDGYVRVKDRPTAPVAQANKQRPPEERPPTMDVTEDDIPF